jgi:hypothetical protein
VSRLTAPGIGRAMLTRLLVLAACALVAAATLAGSAGAATTWSCGSIANPYPGTRYEGVALSRITATGVSCRTARRVARGAHRRALGIPPTSPIRTLRWSGWRVRGDLRPAHDRYVATRGSARVRWRF